MTTQNEPTPDPVDRITNLRQQLQAMEEMRKLNDKKIELENKITNPGLLPGTTFGRIDANFTSTGLYLTDGDERFLIYTENLYDLYFFLRQCLETKST